MAKSVKFVRHPDLVKISDKYRLNKTALKSLHDILCHRHWYQTEGFDDALAVASTNDLYVLAAFVAPSWCGPCACLEREVFESCIFGFWALNSGLILVSIDMSSSNPASDTLEDRYGIHGYPTVLKLNPDGSEGGRIVGYACGSGPGDWTDQFDALA